MSWWPTISAGQARTTTLQERWRGGLGYDTPSSFQAALKANSDTVAAEDLNTRWQDARRRLFALKGAPPDCDGRTFGDTLVALFADLPERLQHHPYFSPDDRLPEAVYDFLL